MSIENHHREAQAPQKQPDDIEQAHRVTTPSSLNDMPNQPPVYIEGAGTSQYGPGTAPNTRHREEIDPIDRNEKRGLSTKAKVIIGSLTLTSLIGAGIVGKNIMDGAAMINDLKNGSGDRDISAPLVPGYAPETVAPIEYTSEALDNMSLTNFRELDTHTRVDHFAGKLDEWSADSLAFMQKHLSPEQARLVNQPLPEDKSSYTDQDILNSYSINLYDASAQGSSAQEIERGRKLLSVILDPQNSGFDKLANRIGNGQGGIISVYEASPIDYPRIKNQSFMGENIGDAGAEVILGRGVEDGKAFLSLYELQKTDNGNDVWSLKTAYDPSDPKVRSAIESITTAN